MVFNFYTPVEVFFGKGAIEKTGEVARRYGFKALIVTGRESAKKSGALERVVKSLNAHGIQEYILYNEVKRLRHRKGYIHSLFQRGFCMGLR